MIKNELNEFSSEDINAKAKKILEGDMFSSLLRQSEEIKIELEDSEIWQNPKKAGLIQQKNSQISKSLQEFYDLKSELENLEIATHLADSDGILHHQNTCFEKIKLIENNQFLNGKFDSNGALITVQSGAGGVDAQDWAAILTSMYQAFASNQNWKCKIISLSSGEEGGVKSATLEIEGFQAFGFLQEEAGVHRLVRISPFNSGGTRETSFARIEVIPTGLADQASEIVILDQDIRWDYFMASGKGGQSVNTTYSAVRLVHLPTGITISCQNERSQQQNKAQALGYLKNKLAVIELQKKQEFKDSLRGEVGSAEWGNQIRNYVLHPYKLIKDTRSGWETTDVDSVLQQGRLLDVIWSVKRARMVNS